MHTGTGGGAPLPLVLKSATLGLFAAFLCFLFPFLTMARIQASKLSPEWPRLRNLLSHLWAGVKGIRSFAEGSEDTVT